MPRARDVKPQRWSECEVLFDDDEYSVIFGHFDGTPGLGERWNGERDELGFPNQAGYPIWHVVPDFLRLPVLNGILDEYARNSELDDSGRAEAVRKAMSAFPIDKPL